MQAVASSCSILRSHVSNMTSPKSMSILLERSSGTPLSMAISLELERREMLRKLRAASPCDPDDRFESLL